MFIDRKLSCRGLEIICKEIPKERDNSELFMASQVSARSMTPKFLGSRQSFSPRLSVHTRLEQVRPVKLPEYYRCSMLGVKNEIKGYQVLHRAPTADTPSFVGQKLNLKSIVTPQDRMVHKSRIGHARKLSISNKPLSQPKKIVLKSGTMNTFRPVLRIGKVLKKEKETIPAPCDVSEISIKKEPSVSISPSKSALRPIHRDSIRTNSSCASAIEKSVRFIDNVPILSHPSRKDKDLKYSNLTIK